MTLKLTSAVHNRNLNFPFVPEAQKRHEVIHVEKSSWIERLKESERGFDHLPLFP